MLRVAALLLKCIATMETRSHFAWLADCRNGIRHSGIDTVVRDLAENLPSTSDSTELWMSAAIDSDPPLPMLITGIAGVPGYNAFHYFRRRYGDRVIGIRQSSMWPLQGPGIVACDIEDDRAMQRLWKQYRFASVVNCAGSCRLKSCELDPKMAHRVNVIGAENIMRCANRHDAVVIHLSIDLVFSGCRDGQYRETDTPDPVTVYGAKMVEAEQVVRRHRDEACILRISLPMGISFNGHAGAIDWIA